MEQRQRDSIIITLTRSFPPEPSSQVLHAYQPVSPCRYGPEPWKDGQARHDLKAKPTIRMIKMQAAASLGPLVVPVSPAGACQGPSAL